MAFRKDILDGFSGFSTGDGMVGREMKFGEDSELFLGLSRSGQKLYYDPELIVYHAVHSCHYSYRYIGLRAYASGISHYYMDKTVNI